MEQTINKIEQFYFFNIGDISYRVRGFNEECFIEKIALYFCNKTKENGKIDKFATIWGKYNIIYLISKNLRKKIISMFSFI